MIVDSYFRKHFAFNLKKYNFRVGNDVSIFAPW